MKILVISDTHHDIEKAVAVYKKLENIDLVIHCGDYVEDAEDFRARTGAKVAFVSGNCDRSFDEKDYMLVETEAGDLFVTHGHMHGVSHSQEKIFYCAAEAGCVAAIYGHTHIPVNTEWEGIHLINPGSLSRPRDNSSGSFAIIETRDDYFSSKIHYYDDFMSGKDGTGPGGPTGKSKVKGGYLKGLLNYSDRF